MSVKIAIWWVKVNEDYIEKFPTFLNVFSILIEYLPISYKNSLSGKLKNDFVKMVIVTKSSI